VLPQVEQVRRARLVWCKGLRRQVPNVHLVLGPVARQKRRARIERRRLLLVGIPAPKRLGDRGAPLLKPGVRRSRTLERPLSIQPCWPRQTPSTQSRGEPFDERSSATSTTPPSASV